MFAAGVDRCRGVFGILTLLAPVGSAATGGVWFVSAEFYVVGILYLFVASGNDEASVAADGIVGLVPLQLMIAYEPLLIVPVGFVEGACCVEFVAPYECLLLRIGAENGGAEA